VSNSGNVFFIVIDVVVSKISSVPEAGGNDIN
jgi:hypothetical protein